MAIKIPVLIPVSSDPTHVSPSTCLDPTQENLEAVRPGDHLKVRAVAGAVSEAFWVRVNTVDRSRQSNAMVYLGEVDQDLVYTARHTLKDGDLIEVGFQFVLCIMKAGS